MSATEIDRSIWAPFLDSITKGLTGMQAEIEVLSLDLGGQIDASGAQLIGITYDRKNDLIEVALVDFDHMIRSPRQVFVDYAVGGILAAIEIVDADDNRQIVKLKTPLALPIPPEVSRDVAAQ